MWYLFAFTFVTIVPVSQKRITGILLLIIAFVARLGALGRYVTSDEPAWVYRSIRFREALLTRNWGETIQTGHPGIITTWLGSLGVQLTLWLQPETEADLSWVLRLNWLSPVQGDAHQHLAPFLTGGRVMVALTTAICILLIYHLLHARFTPLAAALGAGFLALDPFLAGLSGVLHVDALMGSFALIAILLTLQGIEKNRPGLLLVAGFFSAAALLNKLPGLLLLPFIPFLILSIIYGRWFLSKRGPSTTMQQYAFSLIGGWLIGVVVSAAILLPALWATPLQVYGLVVGTGAREVALESPTYFLGSSVFDPGPLFYPVAIFARLSAATVIGLCIGLFASLLRRNRQQENWLSGPIRFLFPLLLFSLLFLTGISLSSRVFDRYTFPILMILTLLGGLGWATLLQLPLLQKRRALPALILLLLALRMGVNWRYPMAAVNELVGGAAAGPNLIPIGWGEGVSQATRAIELPPDSNSDLPRLFTTNVPAAAPFYPGEVLLLTDETVYQIKADDYIVTSLPHRQNFPTAYAPFELDREGRPIVAADSLPGPLTPHQTTSFARLTRGWVYTDFPAAVVQSDLPRLNAEPARFGEHLRLTGAESLLPPAIFDAVGTLYWEATEPAAAQLRLSIEDERGVRWTKWEEVLVNLQGQAATEWEPGVGQTTFFKLPLQADMPPGRYKIVAELFDGAGAQQGVFDDDGRFKGTGAEIGQFEYIPPLNQPPVELLPALPGLSNRPLVGIQPFQTEVGTLGQITIPLWWEHPSDFAGPLTLTLRLNESDLQTTIDTSRFIQGHVYRLYPRWRLDQSLTAGLYTARIAAAEQTSDLKLAEIELGSLEVTPRDISFELPVDIPADDIIDVTIEQLGRLVAAVQPSPLELRLVMQAGPRLQEPLPDYAIFIHLRNTDGEIIIQADQSPRVPTSLWVSGQVIDQPIELPTAADVDHIALGFYNPNNGNRLRLFDQQGNELPDGILVIRSD